jgi:hypothetical protein
MQMGTIRLWALLLPAFGESSKTTSNVIQASAEATASKCKIWTSNVITPSKLTFCSLT